MTNYEKIKAMGIEELAEWLALEIGGECYSCPAISYCQMSIENSCQDKISGWLKNERESEAEEDG